MQPPLLLGCPLVATLVIRSQPGGAASANFYHGRGNRVATIGHDGGSNGQKAEPIFNLKSRNGSIGMLDLGGLPTLFFTDREGQIQFQVPPRSR